jgi:hypothetical protein
MSRHTRSYAERPASRVVAIPSLRATTEIPTPPPRHIPSSLDDFGDQTDHGHHSITGIPAMECNRPALAPWAVQNGVLAVLQATGGYVSAHDAMAGSVDHIDELEQLIVRLTARDALHIPFVQPERIPS